MKRIVVGLVVVIVIGAVLLGALVVLDHGRRAPASASAPPATAAEAHQAIAAFAPGRPLAVLRSVGSTLAATTPTAATCTQAEHDVAVAGSPSALKALASELGDPVASDLSESLVTAEGQVLADCSAGPSAADRSELRAVLGALGERLSADGLR